MRSAAAARGSVAPSDPVRRISNPSYRPHSYKCLSAADEQGEIRARVSVRASMRQLPRHLRALFETSHRAAFHPPSPSFPTQRHEGIVFMDTSKPPDLRIGDVVAKMRSQGGC